MSTEFSIVDPEEVSEERFPESGTRHRKLTDALGCTAMRLNRVTLAPGEATTPHAHERQEEVYVALDGGHARIDGACYEVPPGGVLRVAPEPRRSVENHADEPQRWLMIGAPPVGTIDDFGEYTVSEE